MGYYYTPEQEEQVKEFVGKFFDRVEWMRSQDGVESLSDKATLDDGSISEPFMVQWFMMMAMDMFVEEMELTDEQLHDRIAGAVQMWSRYGFKSKETRAALRPIFAKYLDD